MWSQTFVQALEERTKESKQEMDILDALEEVKVCSVVLMSSSFDSITTGCQRSCSPSWCRVCYCWFDWMFSSWFVFDSHDQVSRRSQRKNLRSCRSGSKNKTKKQCDKHLGFVCDLQRLLYHFDSQFRNESSVSKILSMMPRQQKSLSKRLFIRVLHKINHNHFIAEGQKGWWFSRGCSCMYILLSARD